ncbi:MAG: PadR family transcriptional regulator [Gammaproteobacteria bacterium]
MAADEEDLYLKKFQKELNAGIVSLVLLATLASASEPLYGYQIAKQLEPDGDDTGPVKQGTLYPVLRALSGAELLGSHVEPSVSGPPRRYYRITDEGKAVLAEWKQAWIRTRDFVDSALGDSHHE